MRRSLTSDLVRLLRQDTTYLDTYLPNIVIIRRLSYSFENDILLGIRKRCLTLLGETPHEPMYVRT